MTQIDQGLTETSNTEVTQGREPSGYGGREAQQSQQQVNVGESERMISVAAGSILALFGLRRGGLAGLATSALGGGLIYRGATGHCPMYAALEVDTAEGQHHKHGIHIEQAFTINRPAEQLYAFWRNFQNLPQIMTHLERVDVLDERRSHWVAKVPNLGGVPLEWDAEMTADEPNTRIAWRALPGANVDNSGEVRFGPALGDRGTEVRVQMDYLPPAGRLGHWMAKLLGENPSRVLREDLRNFKRLMEIGEILTIVGQPRGTCTGQGERYTESQWRPLFT